MNIEKLMYKAGILTSSVYALIRMRHWSLGYTYFTQISNIFIVIIVALQLFFINKKEPSGLHILKYLAVLSLLVTLLVFFVSSLVTDSSQLLAAYAKDSYSSLCMHFVSPVLGIIDYYRNDSRQPYSKNVIYMGFLPFASYMIFIVLLGKGGVRWGASKRLAPYPFLNYGGNAGWFGNPAGDAGFSFQKLGVAYVLLGALGAIFLLSYMLWQLANIRCISLSKAQT